MAFLRQAQLDPESRKRLKPEVFGDEPDELEVPSIRAKQPIVPKAPIVTTEQDFGAPGVTMAGQFDPLGEEYTRTLRSAQGGFGTMVSEAPQTTQTPEQVQEALAGVEARSDVRVQNIIAQQEQAAQAGEAAPTTASQIQELEAQLATPGRGLRQTFGELLTAQQGRRTARERLDKLYAQQRTETQQAGQTLRTAATAARTQQTGDRNYDLAVARFKQAERKEGAASQRRAFEDMREITTGYAKQAYPDDPSKQQGYIAKQLETATPGFLFNTPEGRNYTKVIKGSLVDAINDERGLWDYFVNAGGATEQGDVESLSFKGWKIGDAGPWFGSETIAEKGKGGKYAYLDNLSEEEVWVMKQLIMRDNPEDYPNQKQASLRTGQ